MKPVLCIAISVILSNFACADVEQRGFSQKLSDAAIERTNHQVTYDPAYRNIPYPGGDIAADKGVCADVIIRALRVFEIDLQQLIHEDMKANFSAYPNRWGLSSTDRNIDHRRVPNIETFLTRKGAKLPKSTSPEDYRAGDIVAWNLSGHGRGWMPHIGIVTDQISSDGTPLIVHNIGAGPQMENVLFNWPQTGHYRLNSNQLR